MAFNQQFSGDDKKYNPEATEALRQIISSDYYLSYWGTKEAGDKMIDQLTTLIHQGADPNLFVTKKMYPHLIYSAHTWPITRILYPYYIDLIRELFYAGLRPSIELLMEVIRKTSQIESSDRDDLYKMSEILGTILVKDPNLIDMKFDIGRYRDVTPLIYALKLGSHPLTIRTLLDYGANPDVQDDQGRTPLMLACLDLDIEKGTDIIEILLHYGADTQLEDGRGVKLEDRHMSHESYRDLIRAHQGGRRKTRRSNRKTHNRKAHKRKAHKRHTRRKIKKHH